MGKQGPSVPPRRRGHGASGPENLFKPRNALRSLPENHPDTSRPSAPRCRGRSWLPGGWWVSAWPTLPGWNCGIRHKPEFPASTGQLIPELLQFQKQIFVKLAQGGQIPRGAHPSLSRGGRSFSSAGKRPNHGGLLPPHHHFITFRAQGNQGAVRFSAHFGQGPPSAWRGTAGGCRPRSTGKGCHTYSAGPGKFLKFPDSSPP